MVLNMEFYVGSFGHPEVRMDKHYQYLSDFLSSEIRSDLGLLRNVRKWSLEAQENQPQEPKDWGGDAAVAYFNPEDVEIIPEYEDSELRITHELFREALDRWEAYVSELAKKEGN